MEAAAEDTLNIPINQGVQIHDLPFETDDPCPPSSPTTEALVSPAISPPPTLQIIKTADWLTKLGISCVPIVWLLLVFANKGALLFPLVFVPSLIALIVWKYRGLDKSVGFWALASAYMQGFFIGFLVQMFQVTCLLIVLVFWGLNSFTETSYYFFLIFYSFVGAGWSSEYAKFRIAKKAKIDRPDFNDVHAFLSYSVAAAMGLTTCSIALITFVDLSGTLPYDDEVIILLVMFALQLPCGVLTGYIIGVGIAKKEVFKLDVAGYKIWGLPLIIRALGSITFYITLNLHTIGALVMFTIILLATSGYAYHLSKGLPVTGETSKSLIQYDRLSLEETQRERLESM